MPQTPNYRNDLAAPGTLDLHARSAESVMWNGRRALRLDGLALIPDLVAGDATIEVQIGAAGPCYPGIAFRASDPLNYELAYAPPHSSGLWDAIQYDPVFHGSNTWQVHNGLAYQQSAYVPTNQWFALRIDVEGRRAAVSVGDQPPLIVPRLAHENNGGMIGLWSYIPAYFSDLRVSPLAAFPSGRAHLPHAAPGAISEWLVDGFGVVSCEANGALNLNRYLPLSLGQATLTRRFETAAEGTVELGFGFSDELALAIDGDPVFTGTNTYRDMSDRPSRGYVEPDAHTISMSLSAGVHTIVALLKVTEPFGWGLAMAVHGSSIRLLPA